MRPKECGREGGVSSVCKRRWRLRSRCVRRHSVRYLRAPPPFACWPLIGPLLSVIIHKRPSRTNDKMLAASAVRVAIFLPLTRDLKRKAIQTIEMSTCQLLVAISSRLPQPRIGPQNKYRAGSHACRMWMPRPDCFWRGNSSRAPLSCALGDL